MSARTRSLPVWDTPAVLALVSLIAGPSVLPVIAPLIGGIFIRASSCWTPRAKRWASAAAVVPAVAVILVLLSIVTVVDEPATVLLSAVSVSVVGFVPVLAGLLLLGAWARLPVEPLPRA